MNTEEKIHVILYSIYYHQDISFENAKNDILSEIREAKIKMLEGLKHKRKNKLYHLTSGQLNSYRIKMKENKRYNELISELREEGREKDGV